MSTTAVGPIQLVELAVPTASELRDCTDATGAIAASWAFRGLKAVARAEQLELLGHTDFVTAEASSIARFPLQQHRKLRYVLALSSPPPLTEGVSSIGLPLVPSVIRAGDPQGDPDTVLAYVLTLASTSDNTHLLELDGAVHPGHAGSGAEEALWQQVLLLAAELDRTSILTFMTQSGDDDPRADDLLSPTGFGRLHRDADTEVFAGRNFTLQQCERLSMMTVPDDAPIDAWISSAQRKAGDGYTCTTWHGATPAHLQDDVAELFRRMSVDVPVGDLDYEQENWDAARIRDHDAEITAGGHVQLTTVIHDAAGDPAAFSVLQIPSDRQGFAYQNETLVHGDHRGKRLGLLSKAVNLQALKQFRPDVGRIHTWNAGENSHMLAINDEMGYRPTGWEGCWQLRLPAVPDSPDGSQ